MTLRQFRRDFPFIAYGDEYSRWRKVGKYYKWLFDRLHTEGPTQYTAHEWRKLHCEFEWRVKNFNKLFRNLPRPTKEQYNSDPFAVGKWPEDSLDAVKKFIASDVKCGECARNVAAILTENDYQATVLGEMQYESSKKRHSRNGSRKKPDKEPNGKKEPRINGLAIPEYVRTIERAHEATKHSKLVFK